MFRITSFASYARSRGDVLTYPNFEAFVEALRVPCPAESKEQLHCWCPFTFAGNERRRDTVETTSAIVFDFDDTWSIEEARRHFAQYTGLVHPTWSNTVARPHFRVIIALEEPASVERWRELRAKIIAALPEGCAPDDRAADVARVYFWTHTKKESG